MVIYAHIIFLNFIIEIISILLFNLHFFKLFYFFKQRNYF